MTELYDAILAARKANPGAFQNVSSNYLLGLVQQAKITPQEFATLAQTNTVVLSTNNNNGGTSSLQKGLDILKSVVTGASSSTPSSTPTPSNPSGNPNLTASDNTPNTASTPALKQAVDSIKTNFSSVGIGSTAAIIGGAILLVVLFARRK